MLILFSGLALNVEGVSLELKLHLGASEATKAAIKGAAHAADKIGPSEKTQKLMMNIGCMSKILGPITKINDEHVAELDSSNHDFSDKLERQSSSWCLPSGF
jgi:hypothetical protein